MQFKKYCLYIFLTFVLLGFAFILYFKDLTFHPIFNIYSGLIIFAIVLLTAFKSYRLYEKNSDKRLMIASAAFFSSAIYEFLHFSYSYEIGAMYYYWIFELLTYISGILVPLFFAYDNIAEDKNKFKFQVIILYSIIMIASIFLQQILAVDSLKFFINNFPVSQLVFTLFFASFLLYFDLRKKLNLVTLSPFVIGLIILASGSFYNLSESMYTSESRFLYSIVFIIARIFVLNGISDIYLSCNYVSLKIKLLISTLLVFTSIYIFIVSYYLFVLQVEISNHFKNLFIMSFILVIITQYFISDKITKPINNLIKKFGPTLSIKDFEAISETSNDETGILTKELNRSFELNKKYEISITESLRNEKLKSSLLKIMRETLEINELKKDIIENIGENLNANRCYILDYDSDKNIFLEIDNEFKSNNELIDIKGTNPEAEISFFTKELKNNNEIVLTDINKYCEGKKQEEHLILGFLNKYQVKSGYIMPFYSKNDFLGALAIHFSNPIEYCSDEQVNLVRFVSQQVGLALYQSKLYQKAKEAALREFLLRKIDAAIRSTLDLKLMKKIVVNEIGTTLKADRCVIYQIDTITDKFLPVDENSEYLSSPDLKSHIGTDLEKEEFRQIKKIFQYDKKEFIVPDVDNPPSEYEKSMIEKLKEYDAKANYILPITYDNKVLGLLYINYAKQATYISDDQLKFFRALADQVGIAMHHSNIYCKMKNTAKRETLLRDVIETIRSEIDIENVLIKICDKVAKAFNAERVTLVQIPELNDYTKYIIRHEYTAREDIKKVSDLNEKQAVPFWANQLFENQDVLAINNILESDTPKEFKELYKFLEVKSIMGSSIKSDGDKWGILVISSIDKYKYWTEEEKALLNVISYQVFMAIKQAELFKTVKEKAEIEETRKIFLATLIHDLRSPLIAIQKALEYILSRKGSTLLSDFLEYLNDIYSTNIDLLSIINDILTIHHIESGKFKLDKERHSITELIEDTVKTVKYLAVETEKKLEIDIADNIPDVIVDKGKIKRVITNLISNAIKHNPKGTIIKVCAELSDNNVKFSIKDNGKGIPDSEKSKIFQRFPTEKRILGTGLGLYLSKEIVEAHDGTIGFNSEEGKGTEFYFYIPIL